MHFVTFSLMDGIGAAHCPRTLCLVTSKRRYPSAAWTSLASRLSSLQTRGCWTEMMDEAAYQQLCAAHVAQG